MSQPRIEMNATLLPNGRVLVLGGSARDEDATTASLNADLYDPRRTLQLAGRIPFRACITPTHCFFRMGPSRSSAVTEAGDLRAAHRDLLPRVPVQRGRQPATRPTVTGVPGAVTYGATFQVQTPDTAAISLWC